MWQGCCPGLGSLGGVAWDWDLGMSPFSPSHLLSVLWTLHSEPATDPGNGSERARLSVCVPAGATSPPAPAPEGLGEAGPWDSRDEPLDTPRPATSAALDALSALPAGRAAANRRCAALTPAG